MKELVLCAETASDIEREMLNFIDGFGVPKTKIVCHPRLVCFYQRKERKNVWAMTLKDKERMSYHVFLYIDKNIMTIEVGSFKFQPIPVGTTLDCGIVGVQYNSNGETEQVLYCRRRKKAPARTEKEYYGLEADSEEYLEEAAKS